MTAPPIVPVPMARVALRSWKSVLQLRARLVGAERRAAGLSRPELAEHLGVSVVTVEFWEQGRRYCAWSMLRACFHGTLTGARFAQRVLKELCP